MKKLKDKAQAVIDPKSSNSTTNAPSESNSGNSNSTKSKAKDNWTPSPSDQKVASLDEGETFLYDETRVIAMDGKISYAFITQNKKYQYFLVMDGKKSGPYKEAPMDQLGGMRSEKIESADASDGKLELGNERKDPIVQEYSKTISNKLYLAINGKNYGPYDYVGKLILSPDKKKFWAAVIIGSSSEMMAKMGMGNSFIVNESGLKQAAGAAGTIPVQLFVSPGFTAAALSVMDNSAQKLITYSTAGKTQDGSITDTYSENGSPLTVADNGDILLVPSQSPRQLLVNGEEAAMFKVPVTSIRRLYIHSDYKKSTYYEAGKLYRGDGTEEELTGVLFPKFVTLNGQRTIYYYKLFQTDQGVKDVYLCRKAL